MSQLYARVFLKILDSSIAEDWITRHVFEDLLKVADDGVVDMTRDALSRRLNIPLDILNASITKLESPDPKSRNPDHEGKRIALIDDHRDWGWIILNWEEYDKLRSRDDQTARTRERVRRHRAKHPPPTPPSEADPEPDSDSYTEAPLHDRYAPLQTVTSPVQQLGIKGHPTVQMCVLQASKMGLPEAEAQAFHNYYESNGWRVGKNPMRSWVGAMANWRKNWQERRHENNRGIPERRINRNAGTTNDGDHSAYALAARAKPLPEA